MLMSRLNPATGKIEFGRQLGQTDAQMAAPGPLAMPTPAAASTTLPMQTVMAPAPAPVGVGTRANAGGGMMRQPLGQYYDQLEKERGLPGGFLAKTRAIESGNGTNLSNPNSSARGDFQFIKSTAQSMGLSDPMDPYASAKAAADLAAKNMAGIRKATGQDPDGAALYMAHQQGLGGYLGLTRGQMPAGQASSLNGGDGLTASGFLAKYRDKFNGAKVANLDGFVPPPSNGANQGQGPTVANAAAQGLPTGSVTPSGVPAVPDNTYKGGLLGLAGIGDASAPGMDKDVMGKLGDMASQPGGGALGGLAKGLGGMVAAMGAGKSAPAGGITLQANTQAHDPDAQFLAYLDPRRRRAAIGG